MKTIVCIFALLFLINFSFAQKVRYDGHKVIRVRTNTLQEVKRLQSILPVNTDIWSYDSNLVLGTNDIRVDPELLANISANNFAYDTWIQDVEQYLNAPEVITELPPGADPWYTSYHTYAEIVARLKQIAANYSIVTFTASIGKSIEGRDIPSIVFGAATSTYVKRIFWNGGQHAREWIGPPTVLYITEQLLAEYAAGNTVARDLIAKLQFVVVPICNPDGYEYSWTRDRLWRKNRRANTGGTFGVDLNRNWNIKWGGSGSSSNPSSDTYHGTSAFSEPETKAISTYINSLNANKNIIAAIDFHSYSELILRPYGWTTALCPDEVKLKAYGADIQARIRATHGQVYDNIKSIDLYITTGTASDWYYDIGIVGAYCIELRDKGRNGFRLPANEIIPTGQEIYAGVKQFTVDISK